MILVVVTICILQTALCQVQHSQVCEGGWLNMACPVGRVIRIQHVILADSKCVGSINCCPQPNDCTGQPSDGHIRSVQSACQGRRTCSVRTAKELTPCGWLGVWVNNDYEKVTYFCIDEDECQRSDRGGCSANAHCSNTDGSYQCTCYDGYSGNGSTCQDINECLTDRGGCHENSTCVNTPGSHICTCKTGFEGDGTNCQDIDECQRVGATNRCSPLATCTNSIGSYACTCKDGYVGDGFTCTEVTSSTISTTLHVTTSPEETHTTTSRTEDKPTLHLMEVIEQQEGDRIAHKAAQEREEETSNDSDILKPTNLMAIISGVIGLVVLLVVINLVLWCRLRHQRRRRRVSEKQLQMTLQRGGDGGFNVEYHTHTGPRRPTAVVLGARNAPSTPPADLAWECEPLTGVRCAAFDEATAGCCGTDTSAALHGSMSCESEKGKSVDCSTLSARRSTATANHYQKLDYATISGRPRPAQPLPGEATATSHRTAYNDASQQSPQNDYGNNPVRFGSDDVMKTAVGEPAEDLYEDIDDYLKPIEDACVMTELQSECEPEEKRESSDD